MWIGKAARCTYLSHDDDDDDDDDYYDDYDYDDDDTSDRLHILNSDYVYI